MKIFCKIKGQEAVIVGYAQGKRSKPLAIVLTKNGLVHCSLKDLDVGDTIAKLWPNENVVPMAKKSTS